MTNSASFKLRTIGGASVLAISAGFTVPAAAQTAPAPLAAAPAAPAAPAQPANTQQCALTQPGVFNCAPGTDPDGVGEDPGLGNPADPIRIIVQEDAFVTGSTGFLSGASVTGDIGTVVINRGSVVGGANGAVILNNDSVYNNLGFTSSDFTVGIRTVENVAIRNAGTIYGNSSFALIVGLSEMTVVNQGLIQNDAGRTIFAFGDSDASTFTSINNSVTGSIFSTADNSSVIEANDELVIDNAGLIQAFGNGSSAINALNDLELTNSGNIVNESGTTIVADGLADIRNDFGGLIEARGGNAIDLGTDGSRVINNETITATGSVVNGGNLSDILVANNGAMSGGSLAIVAGSNAIVVNRGTLDSTGSFAIAVNDGALVRNLGSITAVGNAVRTGDNSVVVNRGGSIVSANNRALFLAGAAEVTNETGGVISGVIGIDALGTATIVNQAGASIVGTGGNAITLEGPGSSVTSAGTISSTGGTGINFGDAAGDGTVTNEAGGSISGDFGIFANSANTGSQTVVNFGTITGTFGEAGEAVFLSGGDDEYQHWTGAVVNGNVRLGNDNDTFILEGSMSSILGTVIGGNGADTAILGGVLDGDNLTGFEAISLGQLFDLSVSGARSLTGDVSVDGNLAFGLGVDSIAVDGNVDLAGGTITVATPLDAALVGQTISLITATGTLTDNGTAFTIIDDDLLVDYARIAGTADIQITAVDPLIGSGDRNVVAIGNALLGGINAATIDNANFAAFNALPDANALQSALLDALPSLSDGVGREIFESSSAASTALDRHLMQRDSSLWGQIIVRGAEQDALSQSAAGYDSDQLIFTAGVDFALGESIVLGLLGSYSDIDINDTATGTSSVNSDVESIKVGLYTGIQLFDRGFFNAEVSYLTGDVNTSSNGFLGPISSGYGFDGIAGRATLGYDLLPDDNIWLTPSIGVNLANINFDDTVEAGGFGFTVERGDAEFFELRGGVEFGAQISEKVTGFLQGTIVHDTVDSVRSFRLSSTQLPTFFGELPVREQDRFELAAGLDANLTDTISLGVGYQGDFNNGYSAHAGRATLRIGF